MIKNRSWCVENSGESAKDSNYLVVQKKGSDRYCMYDNEFPEVRISCDWYLGGRGEMDGNLTWEERPQNNPRGWRNSSWGLFI
jgi:hypothetical protein